MTDENKSCPVTPEAEGREVTTQECSNEIRTVGPRYQVNKGDDGWELQVELPGVERDAVELAVEDRVLTLKARREPFEPGDAQALFTEFEERCFERSFQLAAEVDLDRIEARLDNGILTLRLHRAGPRRQSIAVTGD